MSKKFFAMVCVVVIVSAMACSKKVENKEVVEVEEDATAIMVNDGTPIATVDGTEVKADATPVMAIDATPVMNDEADMSMLPVIPEEPSMKPVEPAKISPVKVIN